MQNLGARNRARAFVIGAWIHGSDIADLIGGDTISGKMYGDAFTPALFAECDVVDVEVAVAG